MSDTQVELFPDPAVGDVLEHAGIRWLVVERPPGIVHFKVEGMNEPTRRVSLRQWRRVAARGRVVRSVGGTG